LVRIYCEKFHASYSVNHFEKEEIMLLDPTKTVRELALAVPDATRIFARMKIDYCCGGERLLGDACARAGIEVQEVERMLHEKTDAEVRSQIDYQNLWLGQLVAHILETHHEFTRTEMLRLEALTDKVVSAHGERHSELLSIRDLLRELFAELRPHMFKEEQVLFPYLIELEQCVMQQRRAPFAPFGNVNNPVRLMRMEHDRAGDLLREIRTLSANYTVPPEVCASYQTLYQALQTFEEDLHQHIHLENNILFPKAVAMEVTFLRT
jgi:regulator of cell morphogenesis and NO signaling